jgi:predicted DNA-binding transcriptional regulator
MGFTLDSRTKNFIREVNNLVEKGVVKNYAEVIKEIGYNKTAMSSVMNGKLNIPTHIYAKFKDVYKESFPGDYRDEHIALLKDQNQFLKERINELQRKLDELTAIEKTLNEVRNDMGVMAALQKGYQEYWAEHYPPKNVKPENVIKEIHNRAFSSLEKIQKEGIQL